MFLNPILNSIRFFGLCLSQPGWISSSLYCHSRGIACVKSHKVCKMVSSGIRMHSFLLHLSQLSKLIDVFYIVNGKWVNVRKLLDSICMNAWNASVLSCAAWGRCHDGREQNKNCSLFPFSLPTMTAILSSYVRKYFDTVLKLTSSTPNTDYTSGSQISSGQALPLIKSKHPSTG